MDDTTYKEIMDDMDETSEGFVELSAVAKKIREIEVSLAEIKNTKGQKLNEREAALVGNEFKQIKETLIAHDDAMRELTNLVGKAMGEAGNTKNLVEALIKQLAENNK